MEIPDQESRGHKQKTSIYFIVGGSLLILTAITFSASYVNWGKIVGGGFIVNILVAIFIASMKAFLVIYYFMHVKYENRLIKFYGILYPILLFTLLVGFSFIDVFLRVIPQATIP